MDSFFDLGHWMSPFS